MASPHVAGAAALLTQRHPTWSVAQTQVGARHDRETAETVEGRGRGPDLRRRRPRVARRRRPTLLLLEPRTISFGRAQGRSCRGAARAAARGRGRRRRSVGSARRVPPASTGATPRRRTRPGRRCPAFSGSSFVSATPPRATTSGYLIAPPRRRRAPHPVLGPRRRARDSAKHRLLPLALPGLPHAARPRAGRRSSPATATRRTRPAWGSRPSSAARRRSTASGSPRRVANFGVVVTRQSPGTRVEPRIVAGVRREPAHRATRGSRSPATRTSTTSFDSGSGGSGARARARAIYTVVFDSATRAGAGRFGFRFWVDDVTPPTLRLRTPAVPAGSPLLVGATDRGSGVYPNLVTATIDGRVRPGDVPARRRSGSRRTACRAGTASPPAPGLRLPGDEEHRERAGSPAATRAR